MGTLGVFRDDFYNAISILPQSQQVPITTQQTAAVLAATALAGAGDCYITYSGFAVAQSNTTDTALNIIAQLSNAVNAAVKTSQAAGGGFATGLGVPQSIPNLFNMAWTVSIVNQETAAGAITLTGGAGVTIATNGTVSATVIAIATTAIYVVTVTSPTTVLMTRVQ